MTVFGPTVCGDDDARLTANRAYGIAGAEIKWLDLATAGDVYGRSNCDLWIHRLHIARRCFDKHRRAECKKAWLTENYDLRIAQSVSNGIYGWVWHMYGSRMCEEPRNEEVPRRRERRFVLDEDDDDEEEEEELPMWLVTPPSAIVKRVSTNERLLELERFQWENGMYDPLFSAFAAAASVYEYNPMYVFTHGRSAGVRSETLSDVAMLGMGAARCAVDETNTRAHDDLVAIARDLLRRHRSKIHVAFALAQTNTSEHELKLKNKEEKKRRRR